MERNELKKKIEGIVAGEGGCVPVKVIATSLGMSKSKHLTDVLKEMCEPENEREKPTLVCQWARHSNRQLARFFSLPKQAPMLTGLDVNNE